MIRIIFIAICLFHCLVAGDECDDANACTVDWFDVVFGCQNEPIDCRARPRSLTTDFVFLLEAGANANSTRLARVENALRRLRVLLENDSQPSSYRFLTAAYESSRDDDVWPWIVQDFTRSSRFPDLHAEIPVGSLADDEEVALLAGLLATRRILRGDYFTKSTTDARMLEQKPVSLRPGADLHVVLVTGLMQYEKPSGKLSKNFNEKSSVVLSEILTAASSLSLSLGVIIDESRRAAIELWGNPSLANTYSDFRGFNKAFTLKSLIKDSEQANSIQAHFLSKGIELRTFDYKQIEYDDCVRHMYAGYLIPMGIQAKFRNTCEIQVEPCDPVIGCQLESCNYTSLYDEYSENEEVSQGFLSDSDPSTSPTWVDDHIIQGHVEIREWDQNVPFAADLIENGRPVILRNALPNAWPARRKWTLEYLSRNMGKTFANVKSTNASYKITFDPDRRVPMANFSRIRYELPYNVTNMTVSDFFEEIMSAEASERGHYYFGDMINSLKDDVSPNRLLFVSETDWKKSKQFLWVSSAGMITHTHFDQDYNFFVQLYGRKEFTLWNTEEHVHLAPYPRIHPMWHKSRVHYHMPNLTAYGTFTKARALKAFVEPGDILYIPPYHWHHVISLTASASLSTYSDDQSVYDHMNAVYGHDHKFDLLANATGRTYALRLYLDLIIHDIIGFDETTRYFATLLQTRYTGLEHLFIEDVEPLCPRNGKIPTAQHVIGYAKLDAGIVSVHFAALPAPVRDILFADYVEEISAQVVGAERVLAFFLNCFRNQGYYVTNIDDNEHALWDHVNDEEEEGEEIET